MSNDQITAHTFEQRLGAPRQNESVTMRYLRLLLLVFMMAVLLVSCSQTTTTPPATPTLTLSPQARAYLTAALDIMQQHSVNRKKINWTWLRQQAFALADGAKTPADTYSAIEDALMLLGDHHSFFLDPQTAKQLEAAKITSDEQPQGQLLAHGIGYLLLPHFLGQQQQDEKQYALLAQNVIRQADQAGACGWIVDLRTNGGGNMWPMLDGVGPILGEGVVGSFVGHDGVKQPFAYRDGQAQLAGSTLIGVENPYHLKHPLPPIAVLTSPFTASAGEAIVVAFRGRPHTLSFGKPTAGVPTVNEGFKLSDGADLILTVALDADRTGHTYDSAIAPDQTVPVDMSQIGKPGDLALQAATTWLHDQEGC
jgi:carboxyl-terminal processing protease